jgi:hypothetical protein
MKASAAPPASTSRLDCLFTAGDGLGRLRQKVAPMVHDDLGAAMDFEPREGVPKGAAARQCSLGTRVCVDVVKPSLQPENLIEPLDVAAGDRKLTESWSTFLTTLALCRPGHRPALGSQRDAERHEKGAEQNGIGQRVGYRLESPSVQVEGAERTPEWFGRASMQFAGDRLQQA